VGNANVDIVVRVERLPPRGAQVKAASVARRPGGAALNFALTAARLGMRVSFLGCVGSDEAGDWLLGAMRRGGVDTGRVARVPGATGMVIVIVDGEGERTMIAYRGANQQLRRVVDGDYSGFSWVQVSSVEAELASRVLGRARREGCVTGYDPGGMAILAGFEGLLPALRQTDVLFLNRREARMLEEGGGGRRLERVAEVVPLVVVKMGPEGATAIRGAETASAEAFKVPVRDTTGAGDAFDAGLCLALGRGFPLEAALRFANAVAALRVAGLEPFEVAVRGIRP